jgi:hypothetical protein
LTAGSGGEDLPESAKSAVREGRGLSDDGPVLRSDAVAFAEIAFETFKEIRPVACPHDEHVAAVVLISFAAQITERAQRIQGASDDRLRNAKHLGETPDGMRSGRQIHQHQQRHLPIGQVGLTGSDIGDQRPHPASQQVISHFGTISRRRARVTVKPVRSRNVAVMIKNKAGKLAGTRG